MLGNGSTPLLEAVVGGEGGRRKRWWKRVVDEEETKRQVLLLLPMIITNVSYYCITLVSVMFAGHLGQLELAGATLANSWATVTGFAFLTGLSGALETLCGQGFGAKLYRMLGIHLQASCLISCFFSVVISIFWFYSQPILILFHQDPHISKTAAIYMKYLIPGLFAYGFLQNILRFLQTQSVVMPLILFSVLPVGIHFGIIYAMVHWAALGFKGAALAASISLWISTISLALYVLSAKKFQQTWEGFSSESFYYIVTTLKLALPSAAMFCLEDWAFEILVFLAGLMPNSEITTSLTAMCVNTQAIAYMFTYGISSAASTRVSNELGAGNPERAKNAMKTTLMLSLLIAVGVIFSLVFGHSIWAGFFSDSPIIAREFASMMPLLAISVALDSVAGVISGVARGCGWQHLGVYANLAMFYLIGTPVAGLLAFKLKLYAKGLWMGLICGLFCQASTLLLITFCRNWSKLDLSVKAGKSVKSEEELGEGGMMFPSSITPLLEADHGEEEDRRRSWWKRVLDVEVAKNQILFSLSVILSNVFYSCITVVSIMFAGHLGELELAGATLANSWATVTGFAIMTGLSEGLETLCGQGYGARLYRMLGIHLQASCIISFFFSVAISILWLYAEPILIFLDQDPEISQATALYLKYLIPGLFAFGLLENLLRFLQTQSVVLPVILFSVIPLCIHLIIVYFFIHHTALGLKGASLAASISLWISIFLLVFYVIYDKKFEHTWEGFSSESFWYILTNLKLALPNAALVCLEDWASEILVFLAGLMPNPKITTSLTAMCVNTQAIAFMLTYGVSSAASTRVSNELGAGNPDRAKTAMTKALKLSVLLALVVILSLVFGHNAWAGCFGDSPTITREFTSMTPLLAISIALDSVAGVISGVARGCGWQHLALCTNLAMFYLVGMPLAGLLAFTLKLYAKGLWIGLICGLFCQASTLFLVLICRNWTKLDLIENGSKETTSILAA